jgi:hypothetical protein
MGTFPAGFEPASPDVFGDIQATAYTPGQLPVVTGALRPRLEWAIAAQLTEIEFAQLGALYRWQQKRLSQRLDARLEWIDRFNPTEPEPVAELTRNIVESQLTSWGHTYGYPVVNCLISKPSGPIVGHRGGTLIRSCGFIVAEYWP